MKRLPKKERMKLKKERLARQEEEDGGKKALDFKGTRKDEESDDDDEEEKESPGTGGGQKDRDEGGVFGGRGGDGEGASGLSSETPRPEMTNLPSLLELYCGNGNHTVALSAMYRRVAAVVGGRGAPY